MSMDCCVLDREDLQKLQTLIPSEEELCSIRDAKAQFPDSVLGPAEDCLLTLGRIPHLSQRLQLWAFALDYDSLEREIAEPLFYLKLAMEQLTASHTFRCILATVLAIGNFLNGCKASGFELSYLGKLSQVRDTHSRQPLLHHVCVLLLQLYPRSSDLYSDITAVMRVSKCDYSQVQSNLTQLQSCCKASWEQLHMLERDKGKELWGENAEGTLRKRLPRILKECEERLNVLKAVHRRVINRFHSFLLFLGYPRCIVKETSPEVFCKTVSNFALEYRTSHQTIVREKERENEREGETTASTPQCTQPQECLEHCRLQEVLRTPESTLHRDPSLPRSRRKKGQASSKLK
ncbi:FH1/FH2 domain-containing protein 1 isoform X2 [Paramormyrops kingsleyae]|nr:FH1/FH2 domain-containing protein 1-like isoform X2 [Paramormyrops kingsleyae]